MKKAALHNLGCKLNAYETEVMRGLLQDAGYEIVDFRDAADVYVINTCSVTNIADRKSRQMLSRAKKQNPDAIIVAVGCYAQAFSEKLLEDNVTDIIIGNNKKTELVQCIDHWQAEHAKGRNVKMCDVADIGAEKECEHMRMDMPDDRTRACLRIQDGCNQFCSYCLIPYTRGRIRSVLPQDVLAQAERLTGEGCTELVLTGIHLSSYGRDLDREGTDLLSLIKCLCALDGLKRLRIGSLEPRVVTESWAAELAKEKKLCPHFHLSLQSGCDTVLKRMNRHYSAAEYKKACDILRTAFENPAITTDVIVGFPGETEAEFEETRAFVEKIGFFDLHVFKYSRRAGTAADRMDGQLTEAEKASRSDVLIQLGHRLTSEYMKSLVGKNVEVLLEEKETIDGKDYYTGHTKEYVRAALPCEKDTGIGSICRGRVTGQTGDVLLLEL